MFLILLEEDQYKKTFLELVKHIVSADNIIAPEEIKMLEIYNNEMGLKLDITSKAILSLDEVINMLSLTDHKVRIAIYIEALALALADNIQHENEIVILDKLKDAFDISTSKDKQCREWLKDLDNVYARANSLFE